MELIEYLVIGLIVVAQLYLYLQNQRNTSRFGKVFSARTRWELARENGEIIGIVGGNSSPAFQQICKSVSTYLSANRGSVIDISVIKDTVNRETDSLEEEITSLVPIPLYCGLAGTMFGVVWGVGVLLAKGSISSIMSNSQDGSASTGIEGLLQGIVLAMLASLIGILLTTVSTLRFKRVLKLHEAQKNDFYSWIEGSLLPELPGNTALVMQDMAVKLSKFNETFRDNSGQLDNALKEIVRSAELQAEMVAVLKKIGINEVAQNNLNLWRQLTETSDGLAKFASYIEGINGYTSKIQEFITAYSHESNRLHVLEEIRDFFTRHKVVFETEIANSDSMMQHGIEHFRERTEAFMGKLQVQMESQLIAMQKTVEKHEAMYLEANEKSLKALSRIPSAFRQLGGRLEQSNLRLVEQLATQLAQQAGNEDSSSKTPVWLILLVLIALGLLAFLTTYLLL